VEELKIVPIDVALKNLHDHIIKYYETVPPAVIKSNAAAEEILSKTENGYERHYMSIVSQKDGKCLGFASFNYDHTNLGGHRCFIRHLSTVNPEHMAQALELVVEFIWKNLPCENIRAEIYHIKDEATG
jgi:hypothetical protein